MNKVKKLIAELCPEGINWKKLVDVANVQYGYPFDSSFFTSNSEYTPLIRIRDVIPSKASTYYSGEIILSYLIKKGDILVGMDGNFNIGKWNDIDGLLNQRVCKIYSKNEDQFVLNGFLFHFLGPLFKDIENSILGSTVKHLSAQIINRISIPVPPLPIQQQIVQILDSFTQLEAELEAELEARSRQYDFYRNQLLSFEGKDVEWKTLGEIGKFTRGKRFVKTDMVADGVPCIHYGEMYTHYGIFAEKSKSFLEPELAKKLRVANQSDVVFVAAGETIEDIGQGTAWLGDEDVVFHDACFSFKSDLDPKFVAYFSRTKLFHDQIKRHISSGKISSINAKGLEVAKIPIPPIEEQHRIVQILDQFDALVNDISTGLPAEIKARRTQYEYYRNQLLDFKKLETA